MAFCIRKRNKTYKANRYVYFELVKTFRDPSNKAKVISQFIAHLGKADQVRRNLERIRQESQETYSVDRLIREVTREIRKH